MSSRTALRRDALANYERVVEAAREAFGRSGADACMEEIAARAHVGVGTVYRRFPSKDALLDELVSLAMQQLISDADAALARTDGYGLQELLRAFGRSFAEHARYANLMLQRQPDALAARRLKAAVIELTARAASAGIIGSDVTADDVMTLISATRGLVHTASDVTPRTWQRFLDIHLAGMRAIEAPDQPR